MKRLIAVAMLFTLNMSIASAAEVKIKEVVYDSNSQEFTIIAGVKKMCNTQLQYRVRGCTDLIVPVTCFVDIKADGGEACDYDSTAIGNVYLDELGLLNKKLSGGVVTFQNEAGKTRKSVKLSNF